MTFPFWHTTVNFDLLDLDLLDCSTFVEDCSREEDMEEGGVPKEVPLGVPVGEPFLFFCNLLLH